MQFIPREKHRVALPRWVYVKFEVNSLDLHIKITPCCVAGDHTIGTMLVK